MRMLGLPTPVGSPGPAISYAPQCCMTVFSCTDSGAYVQIWVEMYQAVGPGELELLEGVLKAWFTVGRLGGFNGMNLQVPTAPRDPSLCSAASIVPEYCTVALAHWEGGDCALGTWRLKCTGYDVQLLYGGADGSYAEYDQGELEAAHASYVHDISNIEQRGQWCRFWWVVCTVLADSYIHVCLINHYQQPTIGTSSHHMAQRVVQRPTYYSSDVSYIHVAG